MKSTRKRQKTVYTNKWTDSEVEKLKAMMKRGCHADEVSLELGRTETAIRFKAFKMQLSFARRGKRTAAGWNGRR
jgi:hypothetical protein